VETASWSEDELEDTHHDQQSDDEDNGDDDT
jgi:hypothetical protein